MITTELQRKIERGIKLIQAARNKAAEAGQPLEVAYSGGKDSDVILELTRMAGVEYRAIYKNTTIDPPGTIKHARERGAEILQPKMNFRQVIEKRGLPNRFRRTCCSVLKEYKVLDYAIVGVRRDESRARKERYKEPEACRVYSKTEKSRQYYPILDWSKEDVAAFLTYRGVKCAPVYYDEQGQFHPERRLGCMCCPMASDRKRLQEFKDHPLMVRLYTRAVDVFMQSHPNSKAAKIFNNCYEAVFQTIFCKDRKKIFFEKTQGTMFDDSLDCKKFLETYFNITL